MKRKYEQTHPWISFHLDLRKAPPDLWILLGEARSHCQHIADLPLSPDTADELHDIYLAKGALATTAIEGNTLSEAQARQRLDGTLKLPASQEYLGREIDNIIDICNSILDSVESGRTPMVNPQVIKRFNRRVLRGLTVDEGVRPGEISTYPVGVARYRGAPREDCEYLLERLCQWLNNQLQPPAGQEDQEVIYAVIRAVLAHIYIAWIHPFGDGNGRTARLVEFVLLVASGVPSPAAHLLSNHYNQTRSEYYRQLSRASESGGDLIPFLLYAVRGFVEGLRAQLELIQEQQWGITWENFVHDTFRTRTSAADTRRQHLVLDISAHDQPITTREIRHVSVRTAEAYARLNPRTLMRDLDILVNEGLLVHEQGQFRAKKERLQAFVPQGSRHGPR